MIRKLLSFTLFTLILGATAHVSAQNLIFGQQTIDMSSFTFLPPDSLTHHTQSMGVITVDTSASDSTARLWQIGNSNKSFFANGGPAAGIMTDTLNPYPINANSSFTVFFKGNWLNPIIYFTHKYQTTAGLDGGIVEFSLDSGMTWQNIKGDCNGDSSQWSPGVITQNCYLKTDTLYNGEMGFSGTSNDWDTTWIQFFTSLPLRTTNGSCDFMSPQGITLRFRFISDSVADSLDGWLIGSLAVREDRYESVARISKSSNLPVYPNPAVDGVFHFPKLDNEKMYNLEIINTTGQLVMNVPYQQQINISGYAKGVYFYIVKGHNEQYAGYLNHE